MGAGKGNRSQLVTKRYRLAFLFWVNAAKESGFYKSQSPPKERGRRKGD
nr:MAG TPA: hypothetical protein [Caudoviricetes sp.]